MSGFGKIFGAWGSKSVTTATPPNDPWWMTKAKAELGQHEVPGSASNPRIVEYFASTSFGAHEDSANAWCSAFVNWVIGPSGTKSAAAQSWKKWGKSLDAPKYGCIVVFDRGGGKGHVGFVVAFDEKHLTVLGGNQSNAVCIKDFPYSNVLAYRWPNV